MAPARSQLQAVLFKKKGSHIRIKDAQRVRQVSITLVLRSPVGSNNSYFY